jgi:5-methylcytosine-specific restriction endonuclease McrA
VRCRDRAPVCRYSLVERHPTFNRDKGLGSNPPAGTTVGVVECRYHSQKRVVAVYSPAFIDRFWSKVDIRGISECWPWKGYRAARKGGCGFVKLERSRNTKSVSSVAFEIMNGPIADAMLPRIICGSPGCCNPSHVKLRRYRTRESHFSVCRYCGAPLTFAQRYNQYCTHRCAKRAHLQRVGYVPVVRVPAWQKRETMLLSTPFAALGETHKREIVLREQAGRCGRCDFNEWLGCPIVLELDHIDGNRDNWARDNLVFLCPNCHSQTATWRGRLLKGTTHHTRDINGMSLRQILKKSGLTPKGGNYDGLKKKLAGADLPLFADMPHGDRSRV